MHYGAISHASEDLAPATVTDLPPSYDGMLPLLALDDEAPVPPMMLELQRAETVRWHKIAGAGQIGSPAAGLPHQLQRILVDFTRRVQVRKVLEWMKDSNRLYYVSNTKENVGNIYMFGSVQ